MSDLTFKYIPFYDRRLGRHICHDTQSRAFARKASVDMSTWNDKIIRVWDPVPNPNQEVGNCTLCSKCSQLNTVNNRIKGTILGMPQALGMYPWETNNDPFAGAYPEEDTGSNGLASCKTAIHYGIGGRYEWIFNGADGVVQTIQDGKAVSCGTRWDYNQFEQDSDGFIHLGGGVAGGHQWLAHGYIERWDAIVGLCWWGSFRRFLLKRAYLAELLADDGDAHTQERASVAWPDLTLTA